jgi:hypothetical protein
MVRDKLSTFEPDLLKIGNISIHIPVAGDHRIRIIDDIRGYENDNLHKIS